MKEFILPPKGLLVVLVVIALVVMLQWVTVSGIEAWTKVDERPCAFKSWSKSGPNIVLNLACGGKEARTEDAGVILGYLAKPGPMTCSFWASGRTFCQTLK